MILKESISDAENFLRSRDLYDSLVGKFGKDFGTASDMSVTEFVIDTLEDSTEEVAVGERVVVCKAHSADDVDIVETDHQVVRYNGNYYDFTAMQFNDSFDGMIQTGYLPVVQPVIANDTQITEKISTVKGYVMLGY